MKKRIGIITCSVIGSCLVASSVISGLVLSLVKTDNTTTLNINNDIQPVMFDNKKFASKQDSYNYAVNLLKTENVDSPNNNLYSLNINDGYHLFNTPTDVNNYIDSMIKPIKTQTNINKHNIDPTDNSLYINEMYKYNIDITNNTVYQNNNYNVYQQTGNTFISDLNNPNALLDAKKSFLSIHKGYYFNGLYFKNKMDLGKYLQDEYIKECTNNISNANYRKIYYSVNNAEKIYSNPIDFSDNNKNLYNDVKDFANANAIKYLRIIDKNNNAQYFPIDPITNEIKNIQNIKISSLPIIKKVSTDNENLYIVDCNQTEKYNLIGPYFIKTSGNVENITDPDMWKETSDTPVQIIKSQTIDVLSSFLELFLFNPNTIANTREWNGQNDHLFFLAEYDDTLANLEQKLYKALMNTKTSNTSNLFNDLLVMFNNMLTTKSYATMYAIPAVYTFIIDRLVEYNATVETTIIVNNYFKRLAYCIQNIFESFFGQDLLKQYNNSNSLPFNYGEYFGINNYGYDLSNIGSILNGVDFIKKYKALFAACYVYTKAISNAQSAFDRSYDAALDNELFDMLADGKGANQNTAEKIKQNFIENGIIDKLNLIYATIRQTSVLSDNIISQQIDIIDKNLDIKDKINEINEKLTILENNNNTDLSQIVNLIKEMQINLGVNPDKYIDNNLARTGINNNKIIYKSVEFNYKNKILIYKDATNQAKSYFNNTKSSWTETNGIFNKYEKTSYKNNIKRNINSTLKCSSTSYTLKTINIINQVSKVNDIDAINVIDKTIQTGGNIINSIYNIVKSYQSDFLPDDIKLQVLCSGILNMIASIYDLGSAVTPPPVNIILKCASVVFDLISGIIGKPEQKIYEYVINDQDNPIKYYWDGGLVMNRLFGLIKDEIRGINDLKMNDPILLTSNTNKDCIYFDKKIYDTEDDYLLRTDVITYLVNHIDDPLFNEFNDNSFQWVYSFENNYLNLNNTNSFVNIANDNQNQTTTTTNPNTLTDYIIGLGKESLLTNKTINHITDIGNELYYNGYHFANEIDFWNNFEKEIINKIRPMYFAQLPNLDIDGYVDFYNQQPYHIPYPYYEPSNEKEKRVVYGKDKYMPANNFLENKKNVLIDQDAKYITYNSNVASLTNNYSEKQIYSIIENEFISNFDIKTKKVLHSTLINAKSYSDFETSLQDIIIYSTEIIPGNKKYFINKSDAIKYILSMTTVDNKIKVDTFSSKMYYYQNSNNEKIYFNTIPDFNKWFNKNITLIK